MYKISDSNSYTSAEVSPDMFGINFVLAYDMEFLETGVMTDLLTDLQPTSLRYPGGSITETMFGNVEYGSKNWSESYFNSIENGTTHKENATNFVNTAEAVGSTIQLVVPTKIAFKKTAGQAISDGTYGDRRAIDPEYLNLISDYIRNFLSLTDGKMTEISAIEIGNEFWGSGQMTASEYGYLAANLTQYLAEQFPNLNTIAQVTYNAGVFSPVEDTKMYLTENGDDFNMHFGFQDLSGIEGLVEYTMPGQGSGVGQTQAIARAFAENSVAIEALDGIVDHVYFRRGFSGIDGERNHALKNIPQTFEDYSGSGPINAYITEWSVRNRAGDHQSEGTNHSGLQYASSTLEAFFELVANEVHGANFWPLTFGDENIDRKVLIDTSDQDLTFGGEIFRLLSNNLPNLTPVFDYEVENEVDIHGFRNEEDLVFFVSERSGSEAEVQVDFANYSTAESFFYNVEYIGGDDISGIKVNSNPIITKTEGNTSSDTVVNLNLTAWSLAMVKVQNITDFDDHVDGTMWNDWIVGKGGNDRLIGQLGNDTLHGNFGHDKLEGGGGDDLLKGGWGNDIIDGGLGNDTLSGGKGADTFKFDISDTNDKISDFDSLEGDVIHVTGAEGASHIETRQVGQNLEFLYYFGNEVKTFTVDVFSGNEDSYNSSSDDFL